MPAPDQGYCIRTGPIAHAECKALLLSKALYSTSRAGARHLMRHPEIAAVAEPLSTLAAEVLGADAAPFRATFFGKSPGRNWLVTWHQDTALPMAERPDP